MARKTANSEEQKPIKQKPKTTKDLLAQVKLDVKFKNETQKKLTQAIRNNDVIVCAGPAGTGKSIVTLAAALNLLKDNNDIYKNILLLKSVNQLNGETLPALPGAASEKMQYQNASFFDSLIKLVGDELAGELVTTNKIKFDVIGSFRGRSISNAIIILDETQNISHDNLKTILTRISDNTKIIVLGDPDQIDIRNKKESSLASLVKKVKNKPTKGVEVIEFTEDDIVRHRLTNYFISLFKEEQVVKGQQLVVKKIDNKVVIKNNFLKRIRLFFRF